MFHCINQLFRRHFAISKMSVVDVIQKLVSITVMPREGSRCCLFFSMASSLDPYSY